MPAVPAHVDGFSKLPAELLITIAESCLGDSDGYFTGILFFSQVNKRLRRVILDTSHLWTAFGIGQGKITHHYAQLCIERSKSLPLKVSLSTFGCSDLPRLRYSVCEVLQPVTERIRSLETYLSAYRELQVVKEILKILNLPNLEEIDLDYDTMFFDGPDRTITLADGGAMLRTLSLTGVLITNPNLRSLKSLTLGGGTRPLWNGSNISQLIEASVSLETLTFIGTEMTFDTMEASPEFDLSCSSLLRLSMLGVAPNFIYRLLFTLQAPVLEWVHVETPPIEHVGAEVDWMEAIGQFEDIYGAATSPFSKVRSLTINPSYDGACAQDNEGFFCFLMTAFPDIYSLQLNAAEIDALDFSNGDGVWLGDWVLLREVTVTGVSVRSTFMRVMSFAQVRNGASAGSDDREASSVSENEEDRLVDGTAQDRTAEGSELDDHDDKLFTEVERIVMKRSKTADPAIDHMVQALRTLVRVVEVA
ncbi:hypothetical protein FRB90_001766 [Tulasnella sp. 427]|nr:hypothetical protein FRB90_001766 [Tulasnella sp. 427]